MSLWKLGAALLALQLAAPAAAQETRIGEEGFVSPPASLAEMEWLVGQWSGEGIGGAPAMESWLSPAGNTMVGTFVQTTEEGGIRFTEHLYLMEEGGTLVLRLKHFNADLTSWEEKDDMLTFRLLAIEPCAAYFHALTLRCDGEGGLLAAVRMKSSGEDVNELIFRFQPAPQSGVTYDCDGTTREMEECMLALLERARERKERYLAGAIAKAGTDEVLVQSIRMGDSAGEAYIENECNAVWENWKKGSARNVMSITCAIGLVDDRTHQIWENWLSYADSTSPELPEPGPTR